MKEKKTFLFSQRKPPRDEPSVAVAQTQKKIYSSRRDLVENFF